MPPTRGPIGQASMARDRVPAPSWRVTQAPRVQEARTDARRIGVARTRLLAFACVGMLAGPVTAYCGPIPFLGLVAAHVSRGALQTSDHRLLLPGAVLVGAALGLATDLVTHLPWSRHFLHLDAVIGMIGAPVALWVILRQRNLRAVEV